MSWGARVPSRPGKAGTGPKAESLLSWLRPLRLDALPKRVELRAPRTRYGAAPRLRLLDIADPSAPGALSLEIIDDRHLSLSTENVGRFELDLSGADLAAKGRILAQVDGRSFALDAGSRPVFQTLGPENEGGFGLLPAEEAARGGEGVHGRP